MIEATRSDGGQPRARCVCDECGTEIIIPVPHDRRHGGTVSVRVDEGAANRKLSERGWSVRKGTICPDCVARRKAAPEKPQEIPKETEIMATTTTKEPQLREPTPKQKREIIGLLELAYDDGAKRYKDGESDKSIAEAIGGGILWGWVAQIREDLFGPDTRNQELEALRKDMTKLGEEISTHQAELREAKAEIKAIEGHINGLVARMAAMKARLDKAA